MNSSSINSSVRRRSDRSRKLLFASLTVTFVVTLLAIAITIWAGRHLRESWRARALVRQRQAIGTVGQMIREMFPKRSRAALECYAHPDRIDLDRVPWAPVCLPEPFVGYAAAPGRQVGGVVNAQQMRDRRDVTVPKPAGVFRIFLTGGSFAWSAGAPDEDSTIAQYLERDLNTLLKPLHTRVEVFNAACCGWASTQERIWIENRLCFMEPDLVIALTGANDAHWAFQGGNILDQRTYEDWYYFGLINSALRQAGTAPFPQHPPESSDVRVAPETVAARFAHNIRLEAAALQSRSVPLLVALQPTLSPRLKPLTATERQWLGEPHMKDKIDYFARCVAAEETLLTSGTVSLPPNLKFVDLGDTFAQRHDTLYLDHFHVGDKGNQVMAQRLQQELVRLGLLPQEASAKP